MIFFQMEVEYLGFDVVAEGVKPSLSKVKAVAEGPVPTSVRDIRSFLGLRVFTGNSSDTSVKSQLPLLISPRKAEQRSGVQRSGEREEIQRSRTSRPRW